MSTLRSALREALEQLTAAQVPSASLAAELLLLHVLERDRTFLYAHPEAELSLDQERAYRHLLNRRAIGPALPPWLDEGLAEDLAQSRVEGRRVVGGTLAEVVLRAGPAWESHGGLAAAQLLRGALAAGTLLPLPALASRSLASRSCRRTSATPPAP